MTNKKKRQGVYRQIVVIINKRRRSRRGYGRFISKSKGRELIVDRETQIDCTHSIGQVRQRLIETLQRSGDVAKFLRLFTVPGETLLFLHQTLLDGTGTGIHFLHASDQLRLFALDGFGADAEMSLQACG